MEQQWYQYTQQIYDFWVVNRKTRSATDLWRLFTVQEVAFSSCDAHVLATRQGTARLQHGGVLVEGQL